MKTQLCIAIFFAIVASLRAQDPGLIDVERLEQLNAIRYDLDGNGEVTFTTAADAVGSFGTAADEAAALGEAALYAAAFTGGSYYDASDMVATATIAVSTAYTYKIDATATYTGYELMMDLDFAGTKWENPTGGTFSGTRETGGWEPIGDATNQFTGTFEGNGHTLSNIFIDRNILAVGLFGSVGDGGEIRRLGLEGGSVSGQNGGALVGHLTGTVHTCYAKAVDVTSNHNNTSRAGGLVGYLFGGTLRLCYATGNVTSNSTGSGSPYAGGLVGALINSLANTVIFSNCYATGHVTATTTGNGIVHAGGLTGERNASNNIVTSYSIGNATGSGGVRVHVGGLIGRHTSSGAVTASYFDHEASNRPASDDFSKSTIELQGTSGYFGIYEEWNTTQVWKTGEAAVNVWSLCGETEYPKLRVDFDGDGEATVAEFGEQAPCTSVFDRIIGVEMDNTALDLELAALKAKLKDIEATLAPLIRPVAPPTSTSEVTYTMTFNATWSAATHPLNFPGGPHFSPLIGAVHNATFKMWAVGETVGQNAAAGMEQMAESGGTSQLRTFVDAAITAGTAKAKVTGSGIGSSPGSATVRFTLTEDHPEVTIVSMLAPSPDWFIGVQNLALFESGSWIDSKTVDLRLYDAGTDDAEEYSSADMNSDPKVPISRVDHATNNETPFRNGEPHVGTFVFQRVGADPNAGSLPNARVQEGRITALEARNIGQSDSLRRHETEITSLEAGQTALEARNTGQSDSLRRHETEITALEAGQTALEARNTGQSDSLRRHETEITALETTRDEQGQKIAVIETKIQQFEAAAGGTGGTGGTGGSGTTMIYSVPVASGATQVYPNPTDRQLQFANLAPGHYIYKIYTSSGNLLRSGSVQGEDVVDISMISAGQYIIVLQDERDHEVLRDLLLIK